ncbi:leucine-rich melanocyte differentiation-associated protein [Aplysia californica]|uniref:Leucine-rich melanocyte differentiation-associated protein n=1 Tax=Aplysia californica TaxID=6500 RepID=A0ABM0JUX2_APLCA|nr:leucine-rich melanocyte differentiation-associated protein [Aplysia californica]
MADQQKLSENLISTNENNKTDPVRPTFENGQLSYLGFDVEAIPRNLIQDYCNIASRLDLSYNRLQSLSGLEHFKFLKELVLDNNEIRDDIVFPFLKELHTLTLNKNKLRDLDALLEQLVSRFPNLTYLSLLGNQACPNQLSSLEKDEEDYQRYRYYVLFKLPRLKFLDSSQVTGAEIAEARRVGPFMQVVRPKDENLEGQEEEVASPSSHKYTPLPADGQETEDMAPQGTFGKSKYIYYGRHSEGNRFIRNKDL